jgi:hypothetical protein
MWLKSCTLTLLIVYPVFLAAGVWFYRYMQKTKPQPFPAGDKRNNLVRIWRFSLYILLLPLGVTLALAILGSFDPLFHFIANFRSH